MEYINLTVNGLNSAIREGLASAIRERNKIEREKLEFEKQMFEFNKQLNLDTVKANTDMAETIASVADNFNQIRRAIDTLAQNDAYLKKEIDALNIAVTNLI